MCVKAWMCMDVCAFVCMCMLYVCECVYTRCMCAHTHVCVFLYVGTYVFGLLCACIRRSEVNLRVVSQAPPRLLFRQVSQCVLGSLISLGWLASEHRCSFCLCLGSTSTCCHVFHMGQGDQILKLMLAQQGLS